MLSPIANNLVVHYWGPLGVELFFGLSGYLITYLLVQEFSTTGVISLKKFYLRRGFRILPAFLFFLTAIVGLNLAGILQVPWSSVATSALFVQNYNFHGTSFGDSRYIGHLWSLSAEEQFYLLWPFALAWLGPKRMRKVALFLALVAPGVRVCSYFLTPWLRGHTNTMFHTTYDFFLWGCLLALYPESPLVETILKRLRPVGWFCAVVFFYMIVGPLLDIYGGGAYSLLFGLTLRSLCVAFIIAWLGRNMDSWPAKFLNTAPMRALGVLSYSLYLWQELFMGKGQHTFSNYFLVSVAAALAAACGSYFLLEKPFLKLRRRLGRSFSCPVRRPDRSVHTGSRAGIHRLACTITRDSV
jgi:peptidoglycan/LPS O-acetylase OafA/YrhL